MDIDHEKMKRLSDELGMVLDKEKPANEAPKEVQECLLLLTYHIADLTLQQESPKEALKKVPESWQEDVQAFARMIHLQRTK